MSPDAEPIDVAALHSALDGAIDNAAHWRDYGAADDPEAAALWDGDVKLLERVMPMLLAAPEMLDALRACLAVMPVNWREDGEIAAARRLAIAAIAKAEGRAP